MKGINKKIQKFFNLIIFNFLLSNLTNSNKIRRRWYISMKGNELKKKNESEKNISKFYRSIRLLFQLIYKR